ncbi:MAG TPA: RHS repeat-associated core domain-containing protein [Pyrinomonadaceae bacterium]|nr:RHS repeat-associated core domain-containing protein [Pyrinomonadaceae bacterium]
MDTRPKVDFESASRLIAQSNDVDHLGSTNALTDGSGNVTSSASYDSFGNATGNLATRYRFTGREYDDFTGLHYYRARWYDSKHVILVLTLQRP